MPSPDDELTLQGLAGILRDHMDGTAARIAEVIGTVRDLSQIQLRQGDEIAGVAGMVRDLSQVVSRQSDEIAGVAGIVRDLSQIQLRQGDELAEHRREIEESRRLQEEHRQYIRQIFARMEEHDARFEAMSREIRRILDGLERRGGNGGGQQP